MEAKSKKYCQDCNVDSKLGCLGRSWLQVGLSWRMLEFQLAVFAAQVADLATWLAGLAAPKGVGETRVVPTRPKSQRRMGLGVPKKEALKKKAAALKLQATALTFEVEALSLKLEGYVCL